MVGSGREGAWGEVRDGVGMWRIWLVRVGGWELDGLEVGMRFGLQNLGGVVRVGGKGLRFDFWGGDVAPRCPLLPPRTQPPAPER